MYAVEPSAFVFLYTVTFVTGFLVNTCVKDRVAQRLEAHIEELEEQINSLEWELSVANKKVDAHETSSDD
jgi:ferritin-like metal-binding protein YciE